MSSDNSSSNNTNNTPNDMSRQQRRGSVTSASLSNLFRSNSISQTPVSAFPTPITTSALDNQRRRLSVTTFGMTGTSPTTASSAFLRRASLSTNSDSIDESAIEDDDAVRTAPTTPFTRRMSMGAAQAMRGMRGGISPGTNGRPPLSGRRSSALYGSPPTPPLSSAVGGSYTWGKSASQASVANQSRAGSDLPSAARSDQAFNWSDQLRSRAESVTQGTARPSFSFGLSASPPRGPPPAPAPAATSPRHDRAKSVSDMPAPPAQSRPRAPQKPDHFQERILKGDFYMD
ncbi:hypothetical protein QBC35DRAFT_186101 [Podospora australis]|uniref:Uncharacterized protein n=1 Tax=Podospora australis TaxID=1536484 RepID=A0AAN7ACL1_9PEZI|nr:hypothetical protein QBC35DRAFT_186101 [Podospora australis]